MRLIRAAIWIIARFVPVVRHFISIPAGIIFRARKEGV